MDTREGTWAATNGEHSLRDLLPTDIPDARILCWEYDANTHGNSRVSCQYLYNHTASLGSDLCLERKLSNVGDHGNGVWTADSNSMQMTTRPIIFVEHS